MTNNVPIWRWVAVALAASCIFARLTSAGPVNWNVTGTGNSSDSFTNTANWTGGFPGNGSNVFMVWTRNSGGGATKVVTNSANQFFFASSLTITNQSNKDTVFLTFNGQTFLTNGAGALLFAGASSGANDITLIFSNNLTFNTATYAGGAGNATLSFAGGTIRGSNLTFTGGAGVNRFLITAPTVNLTSNLTLTAGNANNTLLISNSAVTVAGRLTVAGNATDRYFTLTNASLTVSNGVLNTGRLDILNAGALTVTRDWTNNGVLLLSGNLLGGTLTNQTSGTVSNAGFIHTAVVNQGQFQMAGTLSNTFRQTAGINTLLAFATITGHTAIDAGLFNLNGQRTTNALLTIAGTGVLTNAVAGATVFGAFSNAATVAVTADTYFNSAVTNTGAFYFRGAVSNTLVNAGSVTLNNAATITTTLNTGTFNLNGQTLAAGQLINDGTLTNAIAGASLNGLTNAGTFAATANTFITGAVTNTGAMSFRGAISNHLVNSGTVTLNQNATITGTATISAGRFDLNGQQLSNALMVITGTGVLTNSTAGGVLRGTLQLNNGTIAGAILTNAGTLTGPGTILAPLANTGTLDVTGGVLSFGANTFTNDGDVALRGGTVDGNDFVNRGRLVSETGGLISNTLRNTATGFILATNGTLVLAPDFVNAGIVSNSATLVVSNGAASNAGTVVMNGGMFTAAVLTNTGTVSGYGAVIGAIHGGQVIATNGTLNLHHAPVTANLSVVSTLNVVPDWANDSTTSLRGGVLAGGVVTNTATLAGFGTLSNAVVNLHHLIASNGTLTVATTLAGAGTITVANGATLNHLPAWQNPATLSLAGGTVICGALTNAGTVIGAGTITPNFVNAGTLNVAGTLTLGGATFSNAASAVIQNAAGTLALTAANATFVLTAGSSSNTFAFESGTLLFSGAAGTRTLVTAAANAGNFFAATNRNYFIGTLQMNGGAGYTLQLTGALSRALYVGNLVLASGAQFDFSGLKLYYKTAVTTNGVTFLNGTGTNLVKLGLGGEFIFLPASGTQDFDAGGNWDIGGAPGTAADQVRFILPSTTSVLVTQNTAITSTTLADLVISNSGGGVTTLLAQRHLTMTNLVVDAGGRLIVSNGVTVTAPVFVNGGTLNNNGTINGQLTVAGGTADGRYTNTGFIVLNSGTLAGFVLNQAAGTITNAGGTVATALTNAGTFVNLGGVSNRLVNTGTLELRGGDLSGGVINLTTLLATNGTTGLSGGLTNAGLVVLRNTGTLTGGVITNTGTLATFAGGNVDSTIVNVGAIEGTNGTLRLGGRLINLGTVNVTNATWNAVGGITNAGWINLRNTGTLNGSILTNTGTIDGLAGGNVSAQIVNAGLIVATNHALHLTGGLVNQNLLSIGNAGMNNATATVGTAFDNSGGEVRLEARDRGFTNAAALIVNGAFTAAADSAISNYNNSAALLNFTANRIVTNRGTLTFTFDIIKGALQDIDTNLVLIVAGGSNTFHNRGTLTLAQRDAQGGGGGSYPPAFAIFSNQFVNAGSFIVTNTGANKARNLFVTFSDSVTNTAAGTMLLVVNGSPATIDTTIAKGGFVNAGTMIFNDTPAVTPNIDLWLDQAGTAFSNAPGGQLILLANNAGTVTLNADHVVNAGTNLLLGGFLKVNTRTGDPGVLLNNGTLLFGGGLLDVNTMTNTASGVLRGTASSFRNLAGNTSVNFGTIDATAAPYLNQGMLNLLGGQLTGVLSNESALYLTNGTFTILSGGIKNRGELFLRNAGTLTGGTLTNLNGGTLATAFGGNLAGALVNLAGGTIQVTNQTLRALNTFANAGTLHLNGAKLDVVPDWTNTGTMILSNNGVLVGGTLTNSAILRGAGTLSNLLINTGSVTVDGILTIAADWRNAGWINVNSTLAGGTLTNLASGTVTNTGVLSALLVNQGRLVLAGIISNDFRQTGGTTLLTGNATLTGVATLGGGVFSNGLAGATFNGTISNAATIVATQNIFFNGIITNRGSMFWQGTISNQYVQTAGTNTLLGSARITGPAIVDGGIFNLNGLTLTNTQMRIGNAGVLSNSVAGGLFVGDATNAGLFAVTANTTFRGNLFNTGAATVTNATLSLENAPSQAGTITIANAGSLNVTPAWNNSGSLLLRGGYLAGGIATNTGRVAGYGTISSVLFNLGRLDVTGGLLRVTSTLIQTGTVDVASGATLSLAGSWQNDQIINLAGGVVDGSSLVNNGTISGYGSLSASVANPGHIRATNGLLFIQALTGHLSTGTLSVEAGATLQANGLTAWLNTGQAELLGGTLLGGLLTNAGNVSGAGTISTPVVNAGGTLTADNGKLSLTTLALQAGRVDILGTLDVANSWTNAASGVVNLAGGVLTGATFVVGGTVSGYGTISAPLLISSAKTVTVSGADLNLAGVTTLAGGLIDGGATLKNVGTIVGAGTLSATFHNVGTTRATNGTLTIAGFLNDQNNGTLVATTAGTLAMAGSWQNSGTVLLNGGTLAGGTISNGVTGRLGGFGTVLPQLVNSGTVLAGTPGQTLQLAGDVFVNAASGRVLANSSTLMVDGVFTNHGTLSMNNSVGVFNSVVVNYGTWITDPTTNIFNSDHIEYGAIQADFGDVYIFKSNFVNLSSQTLTWNTMHTTGWDSGETGTKFIFDGAGGHTQEFHVAGLALIGGFENSPTTPSNTQLVIGFGLTAGFQNNFALDRLEIGNPGTNSTLLLTDSFPLDGQRAALFVNDFWWHGSSKLIIGSNVTLYYVNAGHWDFSNITLLGDAEIHRLELIPEPSMLLLVYAGSVTAWFARRRKRRTVVH